MVKNENCLLHVTCKTGVIFNSARRSAHAIFKKEL